jgi:serine/threonine-protein kinase RsbW
MTDALSLRNDIDELARLAAFAAEFAARHGLPDTELSRLQVILDELFSNIVRYGYGERAGPGEIQVRLGYRGGVLTIAIEDDGKPFDPLAVSPPDAERLAAERRVGGLGLRFVRELTDSAAYTREGSRNRLVLTRQTDR